MASSLACPAEPVIICGCGPSLLDLPSPERHTTIGVNDVGRLFDPTYLVVVNPRSQFKDDRFQYVEQSKARALYTQLDLGPVRPPVRRFRLGQYGGTDLHDGSLLPYTQNSPYVAVCLAATLGARRIGLIGVDFTDDHFFAATGPHALARHLGLIDTQYGRLAAALAQRGVELVNLSARSRLTSLKKVDMSWLTPADGATGPKPAAPREAAAAPSPEPTPVARSARKVFFVHYRFLSCGTVFETGLREAAQALGLQAEHAYWDDPRLLQHVQRFGPDLLLVVHGRRFVQQWGRRFDAFRSAVWLLDEPYEVDDTAAWSGHFDHVFLNDGSSLARHRNAVELPVAYAPGLHHDSGPGDRRYRVGFVGGANPSRERMLAGLARRGLLDYVVGGPWRDAVLGPLCLSANVPAEATAQLYRETSIVINVFRDRHHFNRQGLPALTMNPRICEALACGALVLSEPREQVARLVPDLPTFRDEAEAVRLIEHFLHDPADRQRVQRACSRQLEGATYANRLSTIMNTVDAAAPQTSTIQPAVDAARPVAPDDTNWHDAADVCRQGADGALVIEPGAERGPGRERGLVGGERRADGELSFAFRLEPGACLIAKLRLAERDNPASNSYHLHIERGRAYLARHDRVLQNLDAPGDGWMHLRLACRGAAITVWQNERIVCRVRDGLLGDGHAFVGAQGGAVHVRALALKSADLQDAALGEADQLIAATLPQAPRVSIVTTVYDRVECLRRCIASVQGLSFGDYEHLIVADHPPPPVLAQLQAVAAAAGDARIALFNLHQRHNNWGIAPAAAGLRRARGEFLSFLSDDNGYEPGHFGPLLSALEHDAALGFAYSSCRYDGRLVLSDPVPRPGRIDLGQPVFRRDVLAQHFGGDLPFDMMAWDWHMLQALMQRGVRWRHVNRPSFIFRLAKYPELCAA